MQYINQRKELHYGITSWKNKKNTNVYENDYIKMSIIMLWWKLMENLFCGDTWDFFRPTWQMNQNGDFSIKVAMSLILSNVKKL